MKGFVIPNTNICVDFWENEDEDYFRFLTHAHQNRLKGIDKFVETKIYTSQFTSWYLQNVLSMSNHSFEELTIGKRHRITDESNFNFDVTVIDANHCLGSVMFLFQGTFGTVLCTGDFRYTPDMLKNPGLKKVCEDKALDILNVDNKFIGEHCDFMSRETAREKVVREIRSFPNHRIEICVGSLGKVDLLKYIAEELQKKICVSEKYMVVMKKLGWESHFTTDENATTLFAEEVDTVNMHSVQMKKSQYGPVKIFVLSPIYSVTPSFGKHKFNLFRKKGVIIIPYSDHSCHDELVSFISAVQPTEIVPIFSSCLYSNMPNEFSDISKNIIISNKIMKIIDEKKKYLKLLEEEMQQKSTPQPSSKEGLILPSTPSSGSSSDVYLTCRNLANECEIEITLSDKPEKTKSSSENEDSDSEKECNLINLSLECLPLSQDKKLNETENSGSSIELLSVSTVRRSKRNVTKDNLSENSSSINAPSSTEHLPDISRSHDKVDITKDQSPSEKHQAQTMANNDSPKSCDYSHNLNISKNELSPSKPQSVVEHTSDSTDLDIKLSFKNKVKKNQLLLAKRKKELEENNTTSSDDSSDENSCNKRKKLASLKSKELPKKSFQSITEISDPSSDDSSDFNRNETLTKEDLLKPSFVYLQPLKIRKLSKRFSESPLKTSSSTTNFSGQNQNEIHTQSSPESVSILQNLTDQNLEKQNNFDLVSGKIACFCSTQPADSDKLNFWINRSVTGAIFKDTNFINSLSIYKS